MTVGRVLLGTLVAAALVAWPVAPAQAHVRAVASWPASGEVLNEVPEREQIPVICEISLVVEYYSR